MWDDAVLMQGRQTKRKWKYVFGLLLAALLCLGGAWLAAHPEMIEESIMSIRLRLRPQVPEEWVQYSGSGESVVAGDMLLCAGDGGISAFDFGGRQLYSLDMEPDALKITDCGGCAAVYAPGGAELILAGADGGRYLEIPQGIDLAVPGDDGRVAVITSGSGYLTETKLFTPDGKRYKSIGLTDRAMAMMLFLQDGTLASCCVSTDGQWSLRLDTPEDCMEVPLSAALVYEMKRCGDGIALWTSEGLSFLDASGSETGGISLRDEAVLDWDCGDYAALLIRRFGTYHLMTVTGDTVAECPVSGCPRELVVCGNRVCLLDREALWVYDNNAALSERRVCGARAGQIQAAADGLLLIGDGELLHQTIS